jgi:xanthine/uracil/vitamin C permease (AzgA family)
VADKKISFGDWLSLACKYDPQANMTLACILLLMFVSLLVALFPSEPSWLAPAMGGCLFCAVGIASALALRCAWRWALSNPPWYLRGEQDEADNH